MKKKKNRLLMLALGDVKARGRWGAGYSLQLPSVHIYVNL